MVHIESIEELRRVRRLLRILDNRSVHFPIYIYRGVVRDRPDQTVAFMDGQPDREFRVESEGHKLRFSISERAGAEEEWERAEQEFIRGLLHAKDGR